MTFIIDLPEEDRQALSAKAREQGLSAEQYAQQVLKDVIRQPVEPLSARIRQIWSNMPDEVRAKLPADGASQVDHYVYGVPKRDQ
jgi:hypothetical protein